MPLLNLTKEQIEEKIKYIELSYDEKSDVKKYWFKR